MKFAQADKLEKFIKSKELFSDFESFSEIYTGGSSYNFCVKTKDNKYLLKITANNQQFARLKRILSELGELIDVKDEDFSPTEKILVLPFIDGKKVSYRNMNIKFIQLLREEYSRLQMIRHSPGLILPPLKIEEIAREIDKYLQIENSIVYRFIKKHIWPRMKKHLITSVNQSTVIHGDYTENNILVDKDGRPHIIDFDQIRYGYPAEDWMYLLLQLSGFRNLYGSRLLLNNLINKVNLSYTKEELLYGTQSFYLRLLQRRLKNTVHKKDNIRKNICLLICLLSYFRVEKLISQRSVK